MSSFRTLMTPAAGTLRVEDLITSLLAVGAILPFGTAGAVALADIDEEIDAVFLSGYLSAGGRGGGLYSRVAAEPSHDLKLQSADGAWWELVGQKTLRRAGGASGTNATTAMDKLIAAAVTGDEILIEAGTYTIDTGRAAWPLGVTIRCEPGVVIIPNGSSATLFAWEGTAGSNTTLSATAATGALSVSVTAGAESEFSRGDVVKLWSTYQPAPTRTPNIFDGELHIVRGTSSGVVNLYSPVASLNGFKTTEAAKIVKVGSRPANYQTGWLGGAVRGAYSAVTSNELTAFRFEGAYRPRVEGVDFYALDRTAVRFDDCIAPVAENNTFRDFIGTSQGYGVAFFDATRDGRADNNHFVNIRHAVSTNNSTSVGGTVRDCRAWHNLVEYSAPALSTGLGGDAMDTHAVSWGIDYSHNTVRGSRGVGINMEGANSTARGNLVDRPDNYGILINNYCLFKGDATVDENTVLTPPSGTHAILVSNGGGAGYALGVVRVRGNKCSGVASAKSVHVQDNSGTIDLVVEQDNITTATTGLGLSTAAVVRLRGNMIAAGVAVTQETKSQSLTIASGAVTFYPHPSGHTVLVVTTEAAAATDDFDTLTPKTDGATMDVGHIVTIKSASNGADPVIRDQFTSGAAGNYAFQLPGGTSVTLDVSFQSATFVWIGTEWALINQSGAY